MRKDPKQLEKVTLNLFFGDMARLQHIAGKVGGSKIIRTLVHDWLAKHEARLPPAPTVEVEL